MVLELTTSGSRLQAPPTEPAGAAHAETTFYVINSGGKKDPERRSQGAVAPSHLRALDVVVQIVPERVDQVDGVVPSTGIGVAREQHCRQGHRQDVRLTSRPKGGKIRAYDRLRPLPA